MQDSKKKYANIEKKLDSLLEKIINGQHEDFAEVLKTLNIIVQNPLKRYVYEKMFGIEHTAINGLFLETIPIPEVLNVFLENSHLFSTPIKEKTWITAIKNLIYFNKYETLEILLNHVCKKEKISEESKIMLNVYMLNTSPIKAWETFLNNDTYKTYFILEKNDQKIVENLIACSQIEDFKSIVDNISICKNLTQNQWSNMFDKLISDSIELKSEDIKCFIIDKDVDKNEATMDWLKDDSPKDHQMIMKWFNQRDLFKTLQKNIPVSEKENKKIKI